MTTIIQPSVYYVYYYLRSVDSEIAKAGTPYYVGKGKGSRCTDKDHNVSVPKNGSNIVKVAENLTNNQAKQIEILHIAIHGRIDLGTGILRNRTNGGDGCVMLNEETRKLLGHSRGQKWWNNGKICLQSAQSPGASWIMGRLLTDKMIKSTKQTQRKGSLRVKGTRWWHNGIKSIRSAQAPGPEWQQGNHKDVWNKGKRGHRHWWSNGKDYTQAQQAPGPEWFRSSPLYNRSRTRPTGASNHKDTCWWTNGTLRKRAAECPGEGWTRGTSNITNGSKGMRWWNNGIKNIMAHTSPGEEWMPGRLFAKRAS